jgi:hypothetical protein
LRACQREGLFRIERDRQGVIRLFPGNIMQPFVGVDDPEDEDDLQPETAPRSDEERAEGWSRDSEPAAVVAETAEPVEPHAVDVRHEPAAAEVVDGDVVQERDEREVVDGEEAPPVEIEEAQPKRARGGRKRASTPPKAAKKTEAAAPRARKSAARPRAPRARKTPSE